MRSKDELKEAARAAGVAVSGTKAELLARIVESFGKEDASADAK